MFVSINARLYLESKLLHLKIEGTLLTEAIELLEESDYIDDLDHIVRCFDKTTKIRFSNAGQVQYIKFGSTRDNDPSCNVRFGQLKLSGEDVASFFESSVKCVINAVKEQKKMSHKPVSVSVGCYHTAYPT